MPTSASLPRSVLQKLLQLLLVLALIVAILGLVADIKHTLIYGGVDLRNRVVGARLFLAGLEPYFFHWQPGLPEIFADPNHNPQVAVNRVTITPTNLVLYAVMAGLPYFTQQVLWLGVQWVLLLLTILLLVKSCKTRLQVQLMLILSLLFFAGSYFWRLHVERGQVYILFTFLITLAYWLARSPARIKQILSGLVLGFTIMLRPFVVLMLLPMLVYRQWLLLLGSAIGIGLGFGLPLLFGQPGIWQTYFAAMKIHGRLNSGFLPIPERPANYYPDQLEGQDNLTQALVLPNYDIGLELKLDFLSADVNLLLNTLLLLVCCGFILFQFWHQHRQQESKTISPESLFLVGSLLFLLSEYVSPSPRNSYNDIQWLLPLGLILIESQGLEILLGWKGLLLLLGLFFGIGFSWSLPESLLISSCSLLLYVILSVLSQPSANTALSRTRGKT